MVPGSAALAAQFYAVTLVVALVAWPLARLVLPRVPDGAWAFARLTAPALVTWIGWCLASAGLVAWGLAAAIVGLLAVAVASVIRLGRLRPPRSLRALAMAAGPTEAVYLAAFVAVALVRAVKPEIFGLEKFMNWAFINAILRTETLPPPDPWFAGEPLNYYYFGHMVVAALVAGSGVPSAVGYNLAFAHVFAAFAAGIAALVRWILVSGRVVGSAVAAAVGALAAAIALTAGNLHAALYGVLLPGLKSLGLVPDAPAYWFTNSSRFVGYAPDTPDKTITEFPAYSLVVGDLHAHVLDLPITVAAGMIAVAVMLSRTAPSTLSRPGVTTARRATAAAQAAAFVLLAGWSAITNTWDLPILLLLLGLALLATERRAGTGWIRAGLVAGAIGLAAGAAALVVGLPFWRHFDSFSQGLALPRFGTTLWQALLLYGHHGAIAAAFVLATLPVALAGPNAAPRRAIIVVLVLILAATLLLQVPELVAVRDIYGDTYLRANTMFKMSYQAYSLFAVASIAAAAMLVARAGTATARWVATAVLAVPLALPIAFFAIAWVQFLQPDDHRIVTLDGSLFLSEGGSGDIFVAEFLDQNPPAPGEAILEASGDSYTRAGRISAATGLPTVLGWHVHEWLWRKDPALYQRRAEAIAAVYQGADDATRRRFLKDYNIRYVVIGDTERERYPDLDEAALLALGPLVVDDGADTLLIQVDPDALSP